MPRSWYSAIRSATSSWLPTSAVPAPPRTRPTPAHRFGRDLQAVGAPAVQRRHPPLALGLRGPLDRLGARDRLRVEAVQQPVGLRPRLLGTVTGDHVEADAEAQLAAGRLGALATASSFSATASGGSPQVRYTSA